MLGQGPGQFGAAQLTDTGAVERGQGFCLCLGRFGGGVCVFDVQGLSLLIQFHWNDMRRRMPVITVGAGGLKSRYLIRIPR